MTKDNIINHVTQAGHDDIHYLRELHRKRRTPGGVWWRGGGGEGGEEGEVAGQYHTEDASVTDASRDGSSLSHVTSIMTQEERGGRRVGWRGGRGGRGGWSACPWPVTTRGNHAR